MEAEIKFDYMTRSRTTDYTCNSQVHCIRLVRQNKLHSQL